MSLDIILFDNYDSFTYNLYDYLGRLGVRCQVWRNDALSLEQWQSLRPDALLISPGPKTPADAGLLLPVLAHFCHQIPVLGVCLGHQAIGQYFGAELHKAEKPMHGKTSLIRHQGIDIFEGLPNPMQVMRYHSLLLRGLPPDLEVLASSEEGEIMALRHRLLPIHGVQFHPESILSPQGLRLLDNWLQNIKKAKI